MRARSGSIHSPRKSCAWVTDSHCSALRFVSKVCGALCIRPSGPRYLVFPANEDWSTARTDADITTNNHDDMHAGELETSILLHIAPDLLRPAYDSADHLAPRRPDLMMLGTQAYAPNGVIGRPSLASQVKGASAMDSLASAFSERLTVLSASLHSSAQQDAERQQSHSQ
jgi:hypothetical protein